MRSIAVFSYFSTFTMEHIATSSEHTPGPWIIACERSPSGHLRISAESMNPHVADVFSRDTDAEQEANARIIAAAPDLLAACRDALDCLNQIRMTTLRDRRTSYDVAASLGRLLRTIDL